MTARLQEAFDRLRSLPEPDQDRAAERILEEFAEPAEEPAWGVSGGGTWEEAVEKARRHRASPPPDEDWNAWTDWLREERANVVAGLIEPDPADYPADDPEVSEANGAVAT